MTDKKLKSQELAKKLDVVSKFEIDKKSATIKLSDEFTNEFIEAEAGLTLDQVKKFQRAKAKLVPVVAWAGGEVAADMIRENPEIKEVSLQYSVGGTKVHNYYAPEDKTPVRTVVESYGLGDRGELGKVYKQLKSMFDGINS